MKTKRMINNLSCRSRDKSRGLLRAVLGAAFFESLRHIHCRILLIMLIELLFVGYTIAQQTKAAKPTLKIENLYHWPQITGQSDISNDGKYVFYIVENEIPGKETLHVSNLDKTWETSLIGGNRFQFSKDSKYIIGLDSNSKVRIIKLGTNVAELISGVTDFKVFGVGAIEYISYIQNNNELHVREINSKKEKKYINVNQYHLSPDQKKIVLVNKIKNADTEEEILSWLDLLTNEIKVFWKGGKIQVQLFDKESSRIAFFIDNKNEKYARNIWMYDSIIDRTYKIVDKQSLSIWPNLNLLTFLSFEKNHLFFRMLPLPQELKKGVDVYSYTDTLPMSYQIAEMDKEARIAGFQFEAVVDIGSKVVRRLAHESEYFCRLNDEYGILKTENYSQLISYNTGEKKNLPMEIVNFNCFLSLDGKKLLLKSGWGDKEPNLYTYEIATGLIKNLTNNISTPKAENAIRRFKLLAYLEGSNDILVSDSYDIWKIDLDGKKHEINITNGFGRLNGIAFGLARLNFNEDVNLRIIPYSKQNELMLISVNYKNKDNDFYSVSLGTRSVHRNPKRLTMGSYLHEVNELNDFAVITPVALKKSNGVYFFVRSNVNHAPNYFVTKDFKTIKQISSVKPEQKFNWISSELVSFKDLEGKSVQGILYKPENFDQNKKYPIIFNYYQHLSENLNSYYLPELTSSANLNIPYFVSNYYLIFTPDIPAIEGAGFAPSYSVMMGAADYFSTKSYVDTKKMGLAGHSWGGGETNYIVTHTGRFAAAIAGAGPTDMIGIYGLTSHGGWPDMPFPQLKLKGTPYTNLEEYINFSSKLFADKLSTPLLLHHNKKDDAVNFSQALSFFNALWKLGKRAWLLQYDGEEHWNYSNEANQLDLTIRFKQFFDHYLKDEPAPIWMTRGIRATKKGVENGYDIDKQIKTPPIRVTIN